MSDLKEKFQAELKAYQETSETYQKEIDKKITAAWALLREAITIAEDHGLNFESNISELNQSYYSESFPDKFPLLNEMLVFTRYSRNDLAQKYNVSDDDLKKMKIETERTLYIYDVDHLGYGGWEHSQICY